MISFSSSNSSDTKTLPRMQLQQCYHTKSVKRSNRSTPASRSRRGNFVDGRQKGNVVCVCVCAGGWGPDLRMAVWDVNSYHKSARLATF